MHLTYCEPWLTYILVEMVTCALLGTHVIMTFVVVKIF